MAGKGDRIARLRHRNRFAQRTVAIAHAVIGVGGFTNRQCGKHRGRRNRCPRARVRPPARQASSTHAETNHEREPKTKVRISTSHDNPLQNSFT